MQVSPELAQLLDAHRIDPTDIEYGECIGSGTFGVVYKACINRLPDVYAAKILRPFASQTDLFYFLREITTVATVTHPAVLRLVGFVLDPNAPVIVSDWMAKGTLDGLRQQKERNGKFERSFTPGCLARIFYGVASALASVHRVGVLHRDVKPENIFLSSDWEPFLGDFGYARFNAPNWAMSEHPSLSDNIGTPLFRAPEILRGEKDYDHKVDVYAFGFTVMVLFAPEDDLRQIELSDGLKCTSETQMRFFEEISEGVGFKQPASVPDHYWRIVEACLRPNPRERPEFTEVMAMMEEPAFTRKLTRADRVLFTEYVENLHRQVSGGTDVASV